MRHDRNWIVDVCLFSGLACFSFFSVVLFSDIEPRHQHTLIALLPLLTVVLAFNIIGFLAIWIKNRVRSFMRDPLRRKKELVLVGGTAAVGLFLINYLILSISKLLLMLPRPFTLRESGWIALSWIWLIEIVVVALVLMVSFYKQLAELREKAERLEESSIKARYSALQSQLNPHFLFNSLNTLVAEIEYNPRNAILFTQNLSDAYRYILKSQQEGGVTWREEVVSLERLERIFRQASPGQKRYRTRFLIENDNRSFALQVDEIAYFYSESKLTFARTWSGKEHVIDFSLDKLAAQLDPDRFFRLNRQVLACVDSIVKLESYFLGKMVVRLKPPFKERIVVSREKVSLLKEWLDY